MIRLAEPNCGRLICPGPNGIGAHYRNRHHPRHEPKLFRARGYFDVMLDFIHCQRNNDADCLVKGQRWTWHTPEVWERWLAGCRVRGTLAQ